MGKGKLTNADLDFLKSHAPEKTRAEWARYFKVDPTSISYWLRRFGLKAKYFYGEEFKLKVLEAVKAGLSCYACARKFGVHRRTVSHWCKEAGIYVEPRLKRQFDEAFKMKVIEAVKDGLSYSACGRKFGLSRMLVRRWCLEAGVKSSFKRGGGRKHLWDGLPPLQLDGITYKKRPEWDMLLIMSRELESFPSPGKLVHKLAMLPNPKFFVDLVREFEEHRKLLESKRKEVEEKLKRGYKYLKILEVKPLT